MTDTETRLDKASESAILKFVARWSMVCVLPLGGFIGTQVWQVVKETSIAINRIDISLAAIDGANKLINSRLDTTERLINSRLESIERNLGTRLDATDRRVDHNSGEIDKMKERFFLKAPPP